MILQPIQSLTELRKALTKYQPNDQDRKFTENGHHDVAYAFSTLLDELERQQIHLAQQLLQNLIGVRRICNICSVEANQAVEHETMMSLPVKNEDGTLNRTLQNCLKTSLMDRIESEENNFETACSSCSSINWTNKKMLTPAKQLLFRLLRFSFNQDGEWEKITEDILVDKNMTVCNKEYQLESAIIHKSWNPWKNEGHFVTVVVKDGCYYLLDDDKPAKLLPEQSAQKELAQSYLVLYTQVEESTRQERTAIVESGDTPHQMDKVLLTSRAEKVAEPSKRKWTLPAEPRRSTRAKKIRDDQQPKVQEEEPMQVSEKPAGQHPQSEAMCVGSLTELMGQESQSQALDIAKLTKSELLEIAVQLDLNLNPGRRTEELRTTVAKSYIKRLTNRMSKDHVKFVASKLLDNRLIKSGRMKGALHKLYQARLDVNIIKTILGQTVDNGVEAMTTTDVQGEREEHVATPPEVLSQLSLAAEVELDNEEISEAAENSVQQFPVVSYIGPSLQEVRELLVGDLALDSLSRKDLQDLFVKYVKNDLKALKKVDAQLKSSIKNKLLDRVTEFFKQSSFQILNKFGIQPHTDKTRQKGQLKKLLKNNEEALVRVLRGNTPNESDAAAEARPSFGLNSGYAGVHPSNLEEKLQRQEQMASLRREQLRHLVGGSFELQPEGWKNLVLEAGARLHTQLMDMQMNKCVVCEEKWLNMEVNPRTGMCNRCQREMKDRKKDGMPYTFSKENNLKPGDKIPEELACLNSIEAASVSLLCPVLQIIKFRGSGLKLRGHSMAFGQNVQQLVDRMLPLKPEELPIIHLKSPIQVPTARANRNRILNALQWLKRNNKYYKHIQISEENLHAYPEDNVTNIVGIRTVELNDEEDVELEQLIEDEAEGHGDMVETVVETQVDGNSVINKLKTLLGADEQPLDQATAENGMDESTGEEINEQVTVPTVQMGDRQSKPANEWCEGFFTMAFPHLFPTGEGDLNSPREGKNPQLLDYIRHLTRLDLGVSNCFATDKR